jgi:ABC-2 type transport system permease protein
MNEVVTLALSELSRRLRSRVFLVGTGIGVAGIALAMLLPFFMHSARLQSAVLILVGPPELTAAAKPLLPSGLRVAAALPAETVVDEALLERYKASEALVLARAIRGLHVTVYAKDLSQLSKRPYANTLFPLNAALAERRSLTDVVRLTDHPIEVRGVGTRFASQDASRAAFGVAFTFTFVLYLVILVQSSSIMSAVMEEKTNRIAEILVSIVDPANLLIAKIVASAVAAFIQVIVWLGTAAFFGAILLRHIARGRDESAGEAAKFSAALHAGAFSEQAILLFFIWFTIGFLQSSLLIAGTAALVSRAEDAQSVMVPALMPIIAAFAIANIALADASAGWAVAASFIPTIAPFVMFARSVVSEVPVWQQALSVLTNVAAIWLLAVFAGKLYRAGMTSGGASPSLRQFIAILRS